MKRHLTWLQIGIIFLFLTSVLAVPVIYRILPAEAFDYEGIASGMSGLLNESLCREIGMLSRETGEQFLQENRTALLLTAACNMYTIIFGMNAILYVGISVLLLFICRLGSREKRPFKNIMESVLNRLGIASVPAAAAGFLSGDIVIIFLIQMVVLVMTFLIKKERIAVL